MQAAKKNKKLLFHWRGSILTREVLNELFDIFKEEAEKKGKFAYVSLNWSQAVMNVSFESERREQQVKMEEANEGELFDENEEE